MLAALFGAVGALFKICWQAGATLPLLIVFALVAGRRGNARLCLYGSCRLASIGLVLAFCGAVWFIYDYAYQILIFGNPESSIWEPFFTLPGLPWSMSFCVQIVGAIIFIMGYSSLAQLAINDQKYPFAFVKKPVYFFLGSCAFFFSAFFLINWPFAGLPQGLPFDRAIFAVMRNAVRTFFMAFTPAGAVALTMLYKNDAEASFGPDALIIAARWLAFWACAGLIPQVGQFWAIIIGVGLRGNTAAYFPGGFAWHFVGVCLLTIAMFLWFAQAILKKKLPAVAYCAFVLYLVQSMLPFARRFGG